jgi:hypothetical protein
MKCSHRRIRSEQFFNGWYGEELGGPLFELLRGCQFDATFDASREMRDLGSNLITTNRALLKPASYFKECLTHTDDLTLMNCIRSWSSGCADVAVKCP